MNHEEFLARALETLGCPKNFREVYAEFREYQKITMDILKEFHRICIKSNIHYSLWAGSMLGAVRNGSQIPWDYDVDIMVPLEQKKILIECLNKEMKNDYYVYCPETDPRCQHYIMRISKAGYKSGYLHVDVFYFFGSPNDERERERIALRYRELCDHRFYRLVAPFDVPGFHPRGALYRILGKLNSLRYDIDEEYEEYHRIASMYPYKTSKYILRADQWNFLIYNGTVLERGGSGACHDGNVLEKHYAEDYQTTIPIQTDDGEYMIFTGYERILREKYGDYMKEPPVSECIKEMMHGYSALQYAKK